jgi:hypothetical protein
MDKLIWAGPAGVTRAMDFIERCFVATTVAGFIGIAAALVWMM